VERITAIDGEEGEGRLSKRFGPASSVGESGENERKIRFAIAERERARARVPRGGTGIKNRLGCSQSISGRCALAAERMALPPRDAFRAAIVNTDDYPIRELECFRERRTANGERRGKTRASNRVEKRDAWMKIRGGENVESVERAKER